MGRAGGSGGHRSGGGVHSSSGSRSGGGGFSTSHSSGHGGGSSSNRGGGGFSSPPSHGGFSSPPSYGGSFDRPPRHHGRGAPPPPYSGRIDAPPPLPPRHHSGGGRAGCFSVVSSILAVVGVFLIVIMFNSCHSCTTCAPNSSHSTRNDYRDEPVHDEPVEGTQYKTSKGTYFEDNLEMELNTSAFTSNMDKFKQQTGITPFVYTCQTVNGTTTPEDGDLDAIYRKLGLSNAVLLIYQERDNQYDVWVYIDDNISEQKFPTSAIDKMEDYVVSNYEGNMSNAQLLSGAFLAACS